MTGNFAALISGFMYLRLRYRHYIAIKKKNTLRREVKQEVALYSRIYGKTFGTCIQ